MEISGFHLKYSFNILLAQSALWELYTFNNICKIPVALISQFVNSVNMFK